MLLLQHENLFRKAALLRLNFVDLIYIRSCHRAILDPGKRRYSRGSWQSFLVVTSLFAAAEMRRQMTEAGVRVRARLRPFVAEFLSDVQLSLRFNSLSSTGG